MTNSIKLWYFDISSILWFTLHVRLLFQNLKLKRQVVNGDGVLSCKVLQDSSEEGLSEVKPRHPEYVRRKTTVYPFLKKLEPKKTIIIESNIKLSLSVTGVYLARRSVM